ECLCCYGVCFFFQAEDGIRDKLVTGVQTCALPICGTWRWQAPEDGWRTTIASGRMASRFRAVSARVSPFDTLEPEALMLMVSAEIGRASCRERVSSSVGGGSIKKNRVQKV